MEAIAAGASVEFSDDEKVNESVQALRQRVFDPAVSISVQKDSEGTPYILIQRKSFNKIIETKILPSFVSTDDFRKLEEAGKVFGTLLKPGACVVSKKGNKDNIQPVQNFSQALTKVLEEGRSNLKGMSRFKGLGEMNKEELAETTLMPGHRKLLKVEISDAILADQTFTKLMGDEVEPRRKFIEDNALLAGNIDT